MSHPKTTVVVVLAGGRAEQTRRCLEALRPGLGPADRAVAVPLAPGGQLSVARRYSWLKIATPRPGSSAAEAVNEAAAACSSDVLVFVDDSTVVGPRWLDRLLQPLGDESVAACGPRCAVAPPQQAAWPIDYRPDDGGGMREQARRRAAEHDREITEVAWLARSCLAIRRSSFEQVAGFDPSFGAATLPEEDLFARIVGRAVVAEGCLVHRDETPAADYPRRGEETALFEQRHGRPPEAWAPPLVSACLIVKDEVENLPSCLSALEGFADEVVVNDTGSTDGTVELARSLGAVVMTSEWADDFGAARNAALSRCQGEWVIWVDADEQLACPDPAALRASLAAAPPGTDGYTVLIENLTGAGVGTSFVHPACRLFKRCAGRWSGRIHEQVVGPGGAPMRLDTTELVRIVHTGYLDSVMTERSKAERNLRLAEAEVAGADGWDAGLSLVSLGRSHLVAGQLEEAIACCEQGVAATTNPATRRLGMRTIAEVLVDLRRPEEALGWVARLRRESRTSVLGNYLEARARLSLGQSAQALELLGGIGAAERDDDGFEIGAHMVAGQMAGALSALGRHSDAADVLLGVLRSHGSLDTHLGTLLQCLGMAGRDLAEVASALPEGRLVQFLAQVLQLPPQRSDETLERFWSSGHHRTGVLAAAASVAPRLALERALVWSSRLRAAGQAPSCPLLRIAGDPSVAPVERARAAAVGYAAFSDPAALGAFRGALSDIEPQARSSVAQEVALLCPALAGEVPTVPA